MRSESETPSFERVNELKKLDQGPHAQRQPTHGKPWWVCLIAALSFCLWGANVLPIQQVEYQLTTNLAISQHRMPMLQKLASTKTESNLGHLAVFSELEIQSDETSPSASANSELRSVRVRVRCPIHRDIHDVERSLNELTAPSLESSECLVFAKQLQKEQWLLESSSHSIKRLELDQERERNAIETDTVEFDRVVSQDTENHPASNPFRLTSFGTAQQPQKELMEGLHRLNQTRTENVESMLLTLERLKAKSRGFLLLTGSPRIGPVVLPLTFFRLMLLCGLCVTVWFLLMGWLHPFRGRREAVAHQTLPVSEISTTDIEKAIRWLQRERIPYLGAIQVCIEANTASDVSSELHTEPSKSAAPGESTTSKLDSKQLLKSLGEGSLVLWIGLFAARLMFDPLWRELIAVAPLAAISRMISGIH